MATMQRAPTAGGLDFWVNQMAAGVRTGAALAYDFIFSEEMIDRDLSDGDFVDVLCNALMGRPPSVSGKNYWVTRLQSSTRFNIFTEFINSAEFDRICREYGIQRGQTPPPTGSAPFSGKIVVLDPGHGTSGSPGTAGYNEAVAMLGLARRIRPLLEAQGITVILTRDNEINKPISVRCAEINIRALEIVRSTRTNATEIAEINRLIGVMQSIVANPGANSNTFMNVDPFNAGRSIHPDLRRVFEYTNTPVIRDNFLVISLHSNATAGGGDGGVRGAEVYFIDPNVRANTMTYYPGFAFTAQSRSFGDILLNHIQSTNLNGAFIPRRAYGLRAENYAMIREINVPAVLVENGFHTNATDRGLLSNPAYMDLLAVSYRNAIMSYFK